MHKKLFLSSAAPLMITVCASAHAEIPADSETDEIVVTASPLERTVGETVIGTSVVNKEELARNLQNTIAETIAREPGISSTYFGAGASRPIIRGLGGDRIRVLDNGIGSIDASVTSPDHAVAIDPSSAERVEIVRGTSMLLYGSSAAGGVVNVFSGRIPTEVPEGGFDATGTVGVSTADDGFEGAGAVDLKLGEIGNGTIVLHGDGFYREADDYDIPGFAESARFRALEEAEEDEDEDDDEEEAFGVLPNSFYETYGGSGGISWIGERGYFGVSGTLIDSEYGIPGGKKKEEEEGEEEEGEEEEEGGVFIDLRQRRIDFAGEWQFDGWLEKATARLGYADYEHAEVKPSGEVGTLFTNTGWEGRLELVNREKDFLGGTMRGAQGFQFRLRDFSAVGEEAFVPPTETSQYGFFALKEYRDGPWRVELGGRYERTNQENSLTGETLSFNGFSVSSGVGFQPTDSVFLGVTGFRTERAPSTEELFSNGPHLATNAFEVGDPTLDEEVATGVEGAFRYTVDRFRFSVNGFYTSYDDFIFEDETGEEEDDLPVFQFQAADATFKGFEAEIEAELFRTGSIDFHGDIGIDYVRATRKGGADEDLPRIPPMSGVLGLEARHEYVDFRFELEAVAEQTEVAAFELPTDGYELINLYATLRPMGADSPFSLRVTASNLTNEDARVHPSFLKDTVPLRGRNFRIALTADL